MFTTSGTYPWSLVTEIFHDDKPSHDDDFNLTNGNIGSVASLLAATLYQGNPDRNHKLWNIVSTKRYILYMNSPFFVTRL